VCVFFTKVFVFDAANGAFKEFDVEGDSYAPNGDVSIQGKHAPAPCEGNTVVTELAKICALCNDSNISYNAVTFA